MTKTLVVLVSDFGFWYSDLFRISDFEFRISFVENFHAGTFLH
jgi:hypothetical protein